MPSTRRAALVGGCLGGGAPARSATPTPTGTPADGSTQSGGPMSDPNDTHPSAAGTCRYRVVEFTARTADPADVADGWTTDAADLTERRHDIVADAAGGSVEVDAWKGSPLEADAYVLFGGAYYRIDESRVAERTVTTYRFETEVPARGDPPFDPVAYADLTAPERRVVDAAVEGWAPGESGFGRSSPYVFESDAARDDCRFLDGERYAVAYEGGVVSLYHDDTGTTAMATYRYALPRVATDAAEFRERAVDERVGDAGAADLSDAARDLATGLFDRGYYESNSPAGEAATSLAAWLRGYDSPLEADAYVRWDGSLYEVTVVEAVS